MTSKTSTWNIHTRDDGLLSFSTTPSLPPCIYRKGKTISGKVVLRHTEHCCSAAAHMQDQKRKSHAEPLAATAARSLVLSHFLFVRRVRDTFG